MGRRGAKPSCREEGCAKAARSLGLCATHYQSARRRKQGVQARTLPEGPRVTLEFVQTQAAVDELRATFGSRFNVSDFIRRAWATQYALERGRLVK